MAASGEVFSLDRAAGVHLDKFGKTMRSFVVWRSEGQTVRKPERFLSIFDIGNTNFLREGSARNNPPD